MDLGHGARGSGARGVAGATRRLRMEAHATLNPVIPTPEP